MTFAKNRHTDLFKPNNLTLNRHIDLLSSMGTTNFYNFKIISLAGITTQ